MAGTLTRDSANLIPTWLGPSSQALILRIVALLINRYYYGFRIIMSFNKTTPSPLALREGFHVVLLPLPRARTCRLVMYSICLFLEMER